MENKLPDWMNLFGLMQEPSMPQGQGPLLDPMTSAILQEQKEKKPKPRQTVAMPIPTNGPAAPEYLRQEIVASQVLSPEDEDMLRNLRGKFKALTNTQLAKADQMRALTNSAMEEDRGKIDWTPAAGLIKAFGGPDITGVASQAAPMNLEDKLKMRVMLEKAAQEPETRVLSEIGEILKGAQSGKFQIESARENSKQKRYETGQLLKTQGEMGKWLDKEITEPLTQKTAQFATMKTAINKGDYGSVMSVLSSIARNAADNKGALSDQDVVRYADATLPGGIKKLEAYLSGEAQITPEYQARLKSFVEGVEKETLKGMKDRLSAKKKTFSTLPAYSDAWNSGGKELYEGFEKDFFRPKETMSIDSEFDSWKKSKGY